MWKFIEKLRKGNSRDSARHFAGFPIEYEWKNVPTDIAAVQDERVMADGRPAYAWWNEILMLRREIAESKQVNANLREQFTILRVAKWAMAQDAMNGDILVRIKRSLDLTPEALERDPGKFCRIEPKPSD